MMNLDQIIYRFKQIKHIKTDKEVATELNLSPTDFSNRKKRETLLPLIIEESIHENVNINWLLTGKGEILTEEEKGRGNGDAIANGHIAIASNGVGNNIVNIGSGPDALNLGEGVQMLQKILSSGNKQLIMATLTNLKMASEACMKKQNE